MRPMQPLTATQAESFVRSMSRTRIDARIAFYRAALGRHGNLSPGAAAVYRAALDADLSNA